MNRSLTSLHSSLIVVAAIVLYRQSQDYKKKIKEIEGEYTKKFELKHLEFTGIVESTHEEYTKVKEEAKNIQKKESDLDEREIKLAIELKAGKEPSKNEEIAKEIVEIQKLKDELKSLKYNHNILLTYHKCQFCSGHFLAPVNTLGPPSLLLANCSKCGKLNEIP